MADFWYPAFSASGRLAVGSQQVTVYNSAKFDSPRVIGPGLHPTWDGEQLYYHRPDGVVVNEAGTAVSEAAFNEFSVAAGFWAGHRTDPPRIIWQRGGESVGWWKPRLSATGFSALRHNDGALAFDNLLNIIDVGVREHALKDDLLVWVKGTEIFGRRGSFGSNVNLSIPNEKHFYAVPLAINGEAWVLTHTDDRLLLYPWGSFDGYVLNSGISDNPTAFFDGASVWAVWSDHGQEVGHRARPNDARRDLRPVVTPPIPPPPVPVPPLPPSTPMQFESKHSALLEAFAARFPPPGHDEDALRDHWTPKLVEQFVFSFPSEGWCWKSTSQGSRPSSDVIARQSNGFWGYDLIPGAGTSSWSLNSRPGPIDLRGQAAIRKDPVNHLGAATPPVTPPVTPPTTRPIPEAYMPWDVEVEILTRFIASIWPKDRVPEVTETGLTGSGTLSRGALGFLIPIQFKTTVAWMNANSQRAPVGMEWWAVAEQTVAAAIAEYRRSQPTP